MFQIITTTDESLNVRVNPGVEWTPSANQTAFLTARSNAPGFISSNSVVDGTKTTSTQTWNSKQDYQNFMLNNAILATNSGFDRIEQYAKQTSTIEYVQS